MKILVPIIAIVLGVLFAIGMFYQSTQQRPGPAPAAPPAASPTAEGEAPAPAPAETGTPPTQQPAAAATPDAKPAPPPAPTADLVGPLAVATAPNPHNVTLGSANPASDYRLELKLVRWGAGVERITLADFETDESLFQPNQRFPYVLAETLKTDPAETGVDFLVYPYAARSITINGEVANLVNAAWQASDITEDAAGQSVDFTLSVVDANGKPVLDIVRTYRVPKDGYDITLAQRLVNRTDGSLNVAWSQYIQGDVIDDGAQYLGDQRLFGLGYFPPRYPNRPLVFSEDGFVNRRTLVEEFADARADGRPPVDIWPSPQLNAGALLVWLASENRYFAVVTHPVVTAAMTRPADIPPLEDQFPRVDAEVFPLTGYHNGEWINAVERRVVFRIATDTLALAPATPMNLDIGFYAGPREKRIFSKPPYSLLNFSNLIRYELGCTWCTFQWLARGLLSFLTFIHNWITFDWGLAIIILVGCVRLLLHPITKRAQVNMMKMGKQMAAMQPEMEKLKAKYKDDQQKLNQEMMKLYREKGMNPVNALGCLPMFLQMPIWVALYAMLYFAIELRHQPAFYGVFQWISGGHWHFLQSLSSPDNFFILFQNPITIPLIFIELNFQSINILPILMAVVFYFQQKFTTPPPQNEQAAQQQRIMKFMVFLFPVFLYSAPSGLTLYILASTTAGVVESYIVRKHIKEQEEAGTLFEAKPAKPGGFRDRMNKMMEAQQQKIQQKQSELQKQQKKKRK